MFALRGAAVGFVVVASLLGSRVAAALPGAPMGQEIGVSEPAFHAGYPSVAMVRNGGFVVVWEGAAVWALRLADDGIPRDQAFRVSESGATNYRQYPAVAARRDGGFVVVWSSDGLGEPGSTDVSAQLYHEDGSKRGGRFQVNSQATGYQNDPAVGVAEDGSFVVVWASYFGTGTAATIQGRRYDSTGLPIGDEFTASSHERDAWYPSIAVRPDGAFVVAWASSGIPGTDEDHDSVQACRFDRGGLAVGSQFQVNTYTTGSQSAPAVAIGPDGSFVVVWASEGGAGTDTDPFRAGASVQAQRFDAEGEPLGAQFQVNDYTAGWQHAAVVAVDVDGDFAVAWQSSGSYGTDTDDASVQARLYDRDAKPIGGEFQVNAQTTWFQGVPSIAIGEDGDFMVAWASSHLADPTDCCRSSVHVRRFEGPPKCRHEPRSGCTEARRALLVANERHRGREKLVVRLEGLGPPPTGADFGDPLAWNTRYDVCLYDDGGGRVASLTVDGAARACRGSSCWRGLSDGSYRYRDRRGTEAGIRRIGARRGRDGKGRLVVRGANDARKGRSNLPPGIVAALKGGASAAVQIVSSDGGCFEATLDEVHRTDGALFKARKHP